MKQRVLLVNKFYYRRGGDCVYLLNLEELLRSQGHEVEVYAMTYGENIATPSAAGFAPEVRFDGGAGAKLKGLMRTLGMGDIKPSFEAVLDRFKPDIVHLNNIHSYLSPRLASLASRRGVKVVWTLHDYKLICPSYSCLCHGEVCERCFTDKAAVVRERCMKGSLAASALAWLEARRWNRDTLAAVTDTFICPSEFMKAKMEQGGFPAGKLVTLNNFIPPAAWERLSSTPVNTSRDDYYCYIGRLSHEKGVATLLDAASRLPYRLVVAGDGPLAAELRNRYCGAGNISFTGRLDAAGVESLLRNARFSIVPSEWYENNPFSVIESLCAGTPVIGTAIGGIPELIDSTNGATYPSRDTAALAAAIESEWHSPRDNAAISGAALARFSPARHYHLLDKIYGR